MTGATWTTDEITALAGRRVMVVGDLILDRYIWGAADRVSPEAPALSLEYQFESVLIGGAGNVAGNLVAAGARVAPAGVVGKDANGREIRELFREMGAPASGLIADAGRPTTEKTRFMAGQQQVLRLDRERRGALCEATGKRLLTWIEKNIGRCDGVILSDYMKGTLSPALIRRIVSLARKHDLLVVADPKGADYSRYRGVDFITPNLKEALAASGVDPDGESALERAGRKLLSVTGGRGVVITRGHEDTALFLKGKGLRLAPTRSREVYDVTGAGDTFISYFSLALFAGDGPEKAVALGNLAGSLAVEKIGAVAVSALDVINEIEEQHPARKFKSIEELEGVCARLRAEGKKVILYRGAFNEIDAGRIRQLAEARRKGDLLVVGLSSDGKKKGSKGKRKGAGMSLSQRVEILSALDPVDYILETTDLDKATEKRLGAANVVEESPGNGS